MGQARTSEDPQGCGGPISSIRDLFNFIRALAGLLLPTLIPYIRYGGLWKLYAPRPLSLHLLLGDTIQDLSIPNTLV